MTAGAHVASLLPPEGALAVLGAARRTMAGPHVASLLPPEGALAVLGAAQRTA